MKKYIWINIAFFILSCSIDTSDSSKNWNKGDISNENGISIQHDGIDREYVLHIPSSYDGYSSVPLIFNFHGGGGTATGQMYISEMNLVADTAGFIVVYPQGSNYDNGVSHWNSMIATEDNKSTADDIGFVSLLIDEISSNYNIDVERVYACGYSNGADFSISLACYLSDKISAVSSVSGLMSSESDSICNPLENTGILMFNGTSDGERPYIGIDNYYLSVDNALQYWSSYHNTDSVKIENFIDNNGNDIERYKYINSDGLSFVEHYKIINGGHDWFDLNNEGFNIDEIIWSFFSKPNLN